MALLKQLFEARMPTSDTGMTDGWAKFVAVEAEAAFRLLDKDHSQTISWDEFIEFASFNPLIFGPLTHVERLFRAYDSDGNDVIDADEMVNLLTEVEMEITDEPVNVGKMQQQVLFLLDAYARKDRANGTLDFAEFQGMVFHHPELLATATMLRSYFVAADVNNDGVLSRAEFAPMIHTFLVDSGLPMTKAAMQKMSDDVFEAADADKDGSVDYVELCDYMFRRDDSVPIFAMLMSFGKGGDTSLLFKESMLQRLILGLTDPARPEVDTCANCLSPLIGTTYGLTKFGHAFCSSSCVASWDGTVEARGHYLSAFCKSGFRKVNRAEAAAAEETFHRR